MADSAPCQFSVERSSNALGITHKFHGPGMPRHCNEIAFQQINNAWANECMAGGGDSHTEGHAERVCRLLQFAFEAGQAAARREIRDALGVRT